MISGSMLLGMTTAVRSEMWVCPQADGTELYSDQNLNNACRKMEKQPPLMRVPSVPMTPEPQAKPEPQSPPASEAAPIPTPGRGRSIDPPSEAAISAQAMESSRVRMRNLDTDWTAEKFCIDVITTLSTDPFTGRCLTLACGPLHSLTCHDDLRPMEERMLTVDASISSDVEVVCVRWGKSQDGKRAIVMPFDAGIAITTEDQEKIQVSNYTDRPAAYVIIEVVTHNLSGIFADGQGYQWVKDLLPQHDQTIALLANKPWYDMVFPFSLETKVSCVKWGQ
jgi:hypothetical protein